MDSRMDSTPRGRVPEWLWPLLWLSPALAAILSEPMFVTQDGPAHVYNARIVAEAIGGKVGTPWGSAFEVSSAPVPNWGGTAALLGLGAFLPVDWHERGLAVLTLVGPALGAMALSRGRPGASWRGLFAALLGLNVCWLLGFSGFMLGVAIGLFTLAFAIGPDGRVGPIRAAWIALALVVGYFCHLVSLGLTVIALVARLALDPGPGRGRRWAWGLAGLSPLLPLGGLYLAMMRRGGKLEPESGLWGHWLEPRAWLAQAGWADPVSLAAKGTAPWDGSSASWHGLAAPVLWSILALILLVVGARAAPAGRRGFLPAAILFLAVAMLGPDTLGPEHGHYLPQRFALFGAMLLVPVLAFPESWSGARLMQRGAAIALVAAWAGQVGLVWQYSALCRERVAELLRAADAIPPGSRVGTYLAGAVSPFRSNPLWHADCAAGVRGKHIIWANYETLYYYFPVHFRPEVERPPARAFEELARLDAPEDREERRRAWAELLRAHGGEMDAILSWDGVGDAEGVLEGAGWRRDPDGGEARAGAWRLGLRADPEDVSLDDVMEAGATTRRAGMTGAIKDDGLESIGPGHRHGPGAGGG